MNVEQTRLPGVVVITPRVFRDDRGYFLETWNAARFAEAGLNVNFVQDNHSRSVNGVLRGLHYQINQPQGKLVQVIRGTIYDVAVDMRKSSPHYGQWVGFELSEDNGRQLYIPPGFAHGFCVTSPFADVVYKCTDYYSPADERTVIWNDPQLKIDWPISSPQLSTKDAAGKAFADAESFSS